MSELNYSATRELLSHAKQEKERKQSLWRFIYDTWDDISAAHEAGLTYAKMAESLGVSNTSFGLAKKKALAKMEAEAKALVDAEAKSMEQEEETPNNRGFPPVPGSRKNKKKQFASIEI